MATSFGPYRLLRRIAHGGMGEVYLAVLERSGGFSKTVALKMMLPTVASKPTLAELFESEASVAAMLNHPNIVQIFDHGTIEGNTFITMELVEGPDLSSLVEKSRAPFPPEVAGEIVIQLCRGLSHAHERKDLHGRRMGIVHGDVSPPNILISQDGQAKLADFGLARVKTLAAAEGLIAGKYSYMSPEQARGSALTEKSDLYSLGLILYELLTGARAFPLRETPTETLEALRKADYPPAKSLLPDLPEAVCSIIDRALRVSPRDRFETAAAMSAALTKAVPPGGPEKLSEFVRRHTPESIPTGKLAPEPTEMAAVPINPKLQKRRWLPILSALFAIAWAAVLAWWALHTPPPKPAPPVVHLPRAPINLRTVIAETKPVLEASREPKPKPRPRPGPTVVPTREVHRPRDSRDPVLPAVTVQVPQGFTAHLDHQPLQTSTLAIRDLHPHLIRIHPEGKNRPEITLRLSPPKAPGADWRAAIRSTPWMQIRLNKRPLGQTPRSNLPLPKGPFTLLLKRDATQIRLDLNIPK
jgi:serine/threonine protein kinase